MIGVAFICLILFALAGVLAFSLSGIFIGLYLYEKSVILQGKLAFKSGFTIRDCPHEEMSIQSEWWKRGYAGEMLNVS